MNTNHAHRYPRPGPVCARIEPLLSKAGLGLLEPEETHQLQAHLADCAYCQGRQAAYDRLDTVFRRHIASWGVATPGTQEILDAIRAEEEREEADDAGLPVAPLRWDGQREAPPVPTVPPAHRPHRGFSWMAMVAAVLVIALITTGLVASHHLGGRTVTGQVTALPTAGGPTATATLTPEPNPYPPYTGTLVWNDPLTDNNQGNWTEETLLGGLACQFSGGAYQVVLPPDGGSLDCPESDGSPAGHFINFTLQVTVTFMQSNSPQDQAGIFFRSASGNERYYVLRFSADGHYTLDLWCNTQYSCSSSIRQVFQGLCQICHTGFSQSNTLALVANGDNFTFYANGQQQASGSDGTLGTGGIGFSAEGQNSSSSASAIIIAYQDLKVWELP